MSDLEQLERERGNGEYMDLEISKTSPQRQTRGARTASNEMCTFLVMNCSYILGEGSREIFCREYENQFQHYSEVIKALFQFALKDLFVIRNTHSGVISANFLLPMAFKIEENEIGMKGDFAVSLTEPVVLNEERKKSWIRS